MKIGVFDSGIGGQAVATRLRELLPDSEIISVNDHANVPYGTRSAQQIIALTNRAIQPLLEAQCDVIVIACNTATTNAIAWLRATYPEMKFVGIEPMVKPAAQQTRSGTFAVLATPGTLASERYHRLKEEWAQGKKVLEPDCSTWASLIEDGQADEVPIEQTVRDCIRKGADVIVLACTHYHWLKRRAQTAAGSNAVVLEPTDAISRRITSFKDIIAL